MNSVTFGRYAPFETPVHHLDPRNKILLLILFMVAIFLRFDLWSTSLIISGLILIFTFVIMAISKVSIRSLFASLKAMWILILFLLVIYVFLPNGTYTHVAFTIGTYPIYWDAFYQCGYIILRLIIMVSITMILTATTKPMDLTYAFEWYMTPLKVIRFPVHEIAMTLSIALRFIPTLLDETDRIMKAQASRGVDYQNGGLITKMRAITALIVPLFVSAFERSEELSNAMEARGYDPRSKRTRFKILRFSYRDIIGLFIGLIIFGGVLTLTILDKNVMTIDIIKFLTGYVVGF